MAEHNTSTICVQTPRGKSVYAQREMFVGHIEFEVNSIRLCCDGEVVKAVGFVYLMLKLHSQKKSYGPMVLNYFENYPDKRGLYIHYTAYQGNPRTDLTEVENF